MNWIDECLTQQVQKMGEMRNSNEEATLKVEKLNVLRAHIVSIMVYFCFPFQSIAEQKTVYGIHIALALIYNYKLYTCNVGKCRIILCKTDKNNVLRAVQMSAGCEINQETIFAW